MARVSLDTQVRLVLSDCINSHHGDSKQMVQALSKKIVKYSQTNSALANELQKYTVGESDQNMSCFINHTDKKVIIAYGSNFGDNDLTCRDFCVHSSVEFGSRLKEAAHFLSKPIKEFPEYSVSTTGYSLGGAFAMATAKNKNIESDVFNPAYSPKFQEIFFPHGPLDNIHIHQMNRDEINAFYEILWDTTTWTSHGHTVQNITDFTSQLEQQEVLIDKDCNSLSMLHNARKNINPTRDYISQIHDTLASNGIDILQDLSIAQSMNAKIYELNLGGKKYQIAYQINHNIGQVSIGLFVDGIRVDWILHLSIFIIRQILNSLPFPVTLVIFRVLWISIASLVNSYDKQVVTNDKREHLSTLSKFGTENPTQAFEPMDQDSFSLPNINLEDVIKQVEIIIQDLVSEYGDTANEIVIKTSFILIAKKLQSDVENMDPCNATLYGLETPTISITINGISTDVSFHYKIDNEKMEFILELYINGGKENSIVFPLSLGKEKILLQLPVKIKESMTSTVSPWLTQMQNSVDSRLRNDNNDEYVAHQLSDLPFVVKLLSRDYVPEANDRKLHLSFESLNRNPLSNTAELESGFLQLKSIA